MRCGHKGVLEVLWQGHIHQIGSRLADVKNLSYQCKSVNHFFWKSTLILRKYLRVLKKSAFQWLLFVWEVFGLPICSKIMLCKYVSLFINFMYLWFASLFWVSCKRIHPKINLLPLVCAQSQATRRRSSCFRCASQSKLWTALHSFVVTAYRAKTNASIVE